MRKTYFHTIALLVVPPVLAVSCSSSPKPVRPPGALTLVLHGGEVWTGSPRRPRATAVAIAGARIAGVGDDREILALAGPGTRAIDLRGRRVVPGFIDSHVHFLDGGDEFLGPDLRTARSEEELAQRIARQAEELPAGAWITSGAWDHENWPGAALPTREVLDRHVPDRPVFIPRLDGHMALANSRALEIAGVTRDTEDPEGGEVVRDPETGEPTGVLKDAAMALVGRHVPPWGDDERLVRARAALRHAASLGVTGLHDMLGSYAAVETYQDLRRRGELSARITVYTPIASHERWKEVEVERGFGDRFLRVNGVKGFADGSLGSSTALFLEPYEGDPENRGLALADLSEGGELERDVRSCVAGELQVAIHAIGDRAVRSILALYERVGSGSADPAAYRFRIEHSQHIHPEDLGRYAELGVIASMQPFHAADDGRWAEKRIGSERARTTYAFRDLVDSGATLAFGSDWPVAPLSPLRGIWAAVTRRTLDGENPGGWIPEQKITVEEALRAYTSGSATAGFAEGETGTIEAGKLADLVVLDRDILEIDPAEIERVRVLLTICDGRVVYEAEEGLASVEEE